MTTKTFPPEPRIMAGPASRSIKIDAELWKKIKLIIATNDDDIGIQDYVNDIIRPVVEKDYSKAVKKLNAGEGK